MKNTMLGKTLYFDCFSGISGDMILGAVIDLGVPISFLNEELRALKIGSFTLKARTVKRSGIRAIKFDVHIPESTAERSLNDIKRIISRSILDDDIKKRSIDIFTKMIRVEAKMHGKQPSKVHLHEMGAIDAIVDVVGTCIALKRIGALEVLSSPINVGKGFVKCDHGVFPVPAPATSELLRDIPVFSFGEEGELTTPTGASLISSFASQFVPLPEMKIEKIGYGAGSRELKSHPNLLRVFLGTRTAEIQKGVTVVETTIDDMNPQIFGHLMEMLFRHGALDVFSTHVMMKKNRPGMLISVICRHDDAERLIGIMFRETTTIGVRFRREQRHELERKIMKVKTRFGIMRVKVSSFQGEVTQASPEFDDCARAAQKFRIPLKDVQQEVIAAYTKKR